mmetsp:Transcript_46605/g.77039  ORF Transcript_46605/g.77039 Transcript_46605/m.77039 type:complete len:367 (+) Transcript_46605:34-1134(+)|eukprot:CAMPEP_0119311054 /NCGR_PEP_ID=MMETSP1333-20130426/21430_1 /TAXON_ID=418940 /ORGANISM="Scyphosphaera apsteinii, Strain RCC1455" /LENGTH=366 /DNA_ID=CAMNT_0007315347 /DNA_START=34 /DNA_END=1134 /DNA_ORIENTATION=+
MDWGPALAHSLFMSAVFALIASVTSQELELIPMHRASATWHKEIYSRPSMAFKGFAGRFTEYCMYQERQHFRDWPEFLIDQVKVTTAQSPEFSWEKPVLQPNTLESKIARLTPNTLQRKIARLAPWVYQIEFGLHEGKQVDTKGERQKADYYYHRYRAALFGGLVENILGPRLRETSVIDVACHCGVLSLEFAQRGAGKVTGVDLRQENINQAHFLAHTFQVQNTNFLVGNAREVKSQGMHDVVFCGGLLYHLTFPYEFLLDLYAITGDFLILDSRAHRDAFSGWHLIMQKAVSSSIEGESHVEYQPTYRAMIDLLHGVGFSHVFEIIGTGAKGVDGYGEGTTKSFIAFKRNSSSLAKMKTLQKPY